MEKNQPNLSDLLDIQSINPFDTIGRCGPRNLMFAKVSDNIDAQNKLALESGTLPPEEETLILESLYPQEVLLRASNVGKSQPIEQLTNKKIQNSGISGHFASDSKFLIEIDSIPSHLSTRGEILAIPPGDDCGIESEFNDSISHYSENSMAASIGNKKPPLPPSKLLKSLLDRLN